MYGISLLKSVVKAQNVEESIVYFLTRREKFISDFGWTTVYGIHIYRYLGNTLIDSFEAKDYSSKFDSARQLMKTLCDNVIKPNQAPYVVEDHLL